MPETRHYLVAERGRRGRRLRGAGVRRRARPTCRRSPSPPAGRAAGSGGGCSSALLAEAARRGATEVLLEVRAENTAAQRLYARHGFERIGVRRGYYRPGRDRRPRRCGLRRLGSDAVTAPRRPRDRRRVPRPRRRRPGAAGRPAPTAASRPSRAVWTDPARRLGDVRPRRGARRPGTTRRGATSSSPGRDRVAAVTRLANPADVIELEHRQDLPARRSRTPGCRSWPPTGWCRATRSCLPAQGEYVVKPAVSAGLEGHQPLPAPASTTSWPSRTPPRPARGRPDRDGAALPARGRHRRRDRAALLRRRVQPRDPQGPAAHAGRRAGRGRSTRPRRSTPRDPLAGRARGGRAGPRRARRPGAGRRAPTCSTRGSTWCPATTASRRCSSWSSPSRRCS